jgi:hypothetical protein
MRGLLIATLVGGALLLAFKIQRDDRERPATPPPAVPRQVPGYVSSGDRVAGELTLPSGRLVIGDYMVGEQEPLPYKFPQGPHRVVVTMAGNEKTGDRRTALLTLVAGGAEPTKWEQRGGMGTDGGMGFAAAAETVAAAADQSQSEYQRRTDRDIEALGSAAGFAEVEGPGGLPYVVYSTGFGDGGYPIWIGRDAGGRITRVRIDFGILDWR